MSLVLLLLSCSDDAPEPVTLEEACYATDAGYDSPTDDALEGLDRANCYRSLMGLEPGILDPDLDDASQNHADYMDANNTLTHQQSPGGTGFTGEWVDDRIEYAGYDLGFNIGWFEVVSLGYEPAGAVDLWFAGPYHRYAFTVSQWHAGGYGQTGRYAAMCFVFPFPDAARDAVIYPIDGQLDVPASFDSDLEWPDPAPDHGVVGYPISVTVSDIEANWQDFSNPYELELVSAEVTGPSGDVEFLELVPGIDPYLSSMLVLVPTEPYEFDADYTAEITVAWGDGEQTLISRFRTAPSEE